MKGNRIGAYARYSSDKQNESSIDDQLRRVHDFVKREGLCVGDDLVFSDDAISGASTARPGFEALMRKVKAREIDVLIVESTSRLARDMESASHLHKELVFHGVQLIAISDGIDTSRKGVKQQLGLKALMDDVYLDQLADQTLRGMIGCAHEGLSTGGTPYGFRSVAIPSADPRRPAGFRVEVNVDEAKIVIRIFREYVAGKNRIAIAKGLNADGVPSPRAGSRHREQRGWIDSTIGVILRNTKYVGLWTFNERRWVKNPSTGKRVPMKNDPSEIVRWNGPDILDDELWEAAQSRLKRVHDLYSKNADGSNKGRARAGQGNRYPLSGLLVCGAKKADGTICGAPMVVHGGSSKRYYRCGDFASRGTCSNRTSLREDRVRGGLLGALHERVASPQALDYLRKKYAHWIAQRERSRGAEHSEARARLERTQKRIANLVEVIASGEKSEAILAALRDMEEHAKQEKRKIAEMESAAREPVELPTREQVLERCIALEERLRDEPVNARESLLRMLEGGSIVMTPLRNGGYAARAQLYPLALILDSPPTQGFPGSAVNRSGSGGRI